MATLNTYKRALVMAMLCTSTFVGELQAYDKPNHQVFPHPVNATMGTPDPIGSFNVRLNTFKQDRDGTSEYDIGGHLGYGLWEWGGIHLRSLGVRTTPLTELIGLVGLWRSEQKEQGISFISILGLPTSKKEGEEHHGLSYLVGLTGRMAIHNVLTNDVILHYDVSAKHYIAETGTVVRLFTSMFGVLDTRTTVGSTQPEVLVMPAVKVKLFSLGFLGLGLNVPITTTSSFHRQVVVQIEVGNH
jgi:hypothetical protein